MSSHKIVYRELNGVLLLNKDLGLSSNRALQQVRRLFRAAKGGHTGSLDPLASGVLPICFGEATKFSGYALDADKSYKVTAKLGVITTTDDCEGEVVAVNPVPEFSSEQLQSVINTFMGTTQQTPGMYSALKHNGQPLYKLARNGITVERKPRDITIHKFELLEQTADTLTFEVRCSKGTYIRNLMADLGTKLGCGAHVVALQRTQAGQFSIENSYTLEQLLTIAEDEANLDKTLLPMVTLLDQMPEVVLEPADVAYVRNGRAIVAPQGVAPGEFALVTVNNEFVGIGVALNDGTLVPRRMLSNSSLS